MTTAYATSDDGLRWDWHGTVLRGRPGEWDARGTRLTSVLPDGRVSYDGRATAEENWFERTGLATRDGTQCVSWTHLWSTSGISTSCHSLGSVTGSTTRPAYLTRATSYAPS